LVAVLVTGSMSRTIRVAKYNQLEGIAEYAGRDAFYSIRKEEERKRGTRLTPRPSLLGHPPHYLFLGPKASGGGKR
jgi:hypothetical protein